MASWLKSLASNVFAFAGEDADSGPRPRVIIIGAGLGGLAFAHGLMKYGIDFTIFERDEEVDSRPQGYRVKLLGPGILTLRSILLPEVWAQVEASLPLASVGETNLDVFDAHITARRVPELSPGLAEAGPRVVDRATLRRVLLKPLVDKIVFGRRFSHYESRGENNVDVYFDGLAGPESGSLLVGCDGARSRVRKQRLPDHKPRQMDGCCIFGKTMLTPELQAAFPEAGQQHMTLCREPTPIIATVARGDTPLVLLSDPVRFPKSDDAGLSMPQDYMYWTLIGRARAFSATDAHLEALAKASAPDITLGLTKFWHPSIRALFELQDRSRTASLRSWKGDLSIPVWKPSNVTLLGDAIHLMSPAGGIGTTTAMRDAQTLCDALGKGGVSVASVARYEEQMRVYAQQSLNISNAGGAILFGQPPLEAQPIVDL